MTIFTTKTATPDDEVFAAIHETVEFRRQVLNAGNADSIAGTPMTSIEDEDTAFIYFHSVNDLLENASESPGLMKEIIAYIREVLDEYKQMTATQLYSEPVVVARVRGNQVIMPECVYLRLAELERSLMN